MFFILLFFEHFFEFIFLIVYMFCLFFLFFFKKKKTLFTFGQVQSNTRDGRARHPPTNHSFRVCKVNLATLKVAKNSNGDKSPAG